MKTVIIPDIHTKFDVAESIIQKETPDNVVFLGDYFDAVDNTLETTEQTALWLKDSLEKKDRIHLLGNHDLSYLNTKHMCSGFTESKLQVLKLAQVDLRKLRHYCWVGDNWLCTHAGLSNKFYQKYGQGKTVNDFLQEYTSDGNLKETLYSVSEFRGGSDEFAGIVWCDYAEFFDIPGTKQIFGHTRGMVRQTENHICIDTGLQNYAVFENDAMTVCSVD